MEKKSIINVDGRFYYGWVMLICGFMTMFICYVIKANCTSLFYTPICEELGVTRTVYTQTNTVLTISSVLPLLERSTKSILLNMYLQAV